MNKSVFSALACLLLPLGVLATSVPPVSLADLVKASDRAIVGKVIKVEMVDGKGAVVKDSDAMTGPGLDNEIRLHLEVKEVLFANHVPVPHEITVPLWKMWHYRLGKIQESVDGSQGIFLLKGSENEPAYPASFQRSLDEKLQIKELIARFKAKP